MKFFASAIVAFILAQHSFSRNSLQKCAERKRQMIEKFLKQGKLDSMDQKAYIEMDEKWKACISETAMPAVKNIKALTGTEINSQKLKGKITVINFWDVGCTPLYCRNASFEKVGGRIQRRRDYLPRCYVER